MEKSEMQGNTNKESVKFNDKEYAMIITCVGIVGFILSDDMKSALKETEEFTRDFTKAEFLNLIEHIIKAD